MGERVFWRLRSGREEREGLYFKGGEDPPWVNLAVESKQWATLGQAADAARSIRRLTGQACRPVRVTARKSARAPREGVALELLREQIDALVSTVCKLGALTQTIVKRTGFQAY